MGGDSENGEEDMDEMNESHGSHALTMTKAHHSHSSGMA